jgi:hypothetical protein
MLLVCPRTLVSVSLERSSEADSVRVRACHEDQDTIFLTFDSYATVSLAGTGYPEPQRVVVCLSYEILCSNSGASFPLLISHTITSMGESACMEE